MSEPGELTDEEIEHILLKGIGRPDDTCDYERQFATAAVKKYRDYLASQCGPDPCVGCKAKGFCDAWGRLTDSQSECCGIYNQYLGTLTGYAKAMQEMEAKLEAERASRGGCEWKDNHVSG